MTSIDRLSAQSLPRTYIQGADSAQTTTNNGAADKAPGQQAQAAPKTDSVNLSSSAKSLNAARNAANAAPDVREQKVADIKQRIEDGTYSVPSRVLARKMLDQQSPQ